jgi:hypothetical protein
MVMKHVRHLAVAQILALMCAFGATAAEKMVSDPGAVVTAASGTAAATIGPDQGKTGSSAPAAKLLSIVVTPANPSVTRGATIQFIATGKFSDNTTQNITSSVTWKSSNTKVASISPAGITTAGDNQGIVTVTASFEGKRGFVKLTVTMPKLVSITITPAEPYLSGGKTQQLTATGNYSDNTTQDITSAVKWSSSNTKIVVIKPSGLASARVMQGTASITASLGEKRGSVKIIVAPRALVSITVNPADISVDKGATMKFTATGNYSDKTTQDLTASAKWSTSDTTVAAIDPAGFVKAGTKLGTTRVTASVQNKEGSTVLTVAPTLIAIVVTPADMSIRQRTVLQFKAKGTFSDGSTQDLTSAATWTSGAPSIVVINAEGLATGFGVGSTTVSAKYGNKSGSVRLLGTARGAKRPCATGDNENRKGFAKWPAPRFTNPEGTTPVSGNVVVDQLTGLMWTVDSNAPGPAACVPAVTKTLKGAIDYIACLNSNGYLGYNDWRLPNRKELFSLIDYEQAVPAAWVSTQGFSNVQDFYCYDYWLSTTDTTKDMGIFADVGYGAVFYSDKSRSHYVWPVRAGK